MTTVRTHVFWAVLFASLLAGRAILDAYFPTHDFHVRSAITTYTAIAIWATAGFAWTWRTARLRAATLAALFAGTLAFAVNAPVVAAMIGVILAANDQSAWAGIQSSGGAAEMFVMPVIVLIPAVLISTMGGSAALVLRRVQRRL